MERASAGGVMVWVVTGNCDDYYCGCDRVDGSHPVGVYSTEGLAREAEALAKAQVHLFSKAEAATRYPAFREIFVREVALDEMPPPVVLKV